MTRPCLWRRDCLRAAAAAIRAVLCLSRGCAYRHAQRGAELSRAASHMQKGGVAEKDSQASVPFLIRKMLCCSAPCQWITSICWQSSRCTLREYCDTSHFRFTSFSTLGWDEALLLWHHCTQHLEDIEAGDEAGVASNSPAAPLVGVSDVMVFPDHTLQGFRTLRKNLDS